MSRSLRVVTTSEPMRSSGLTLQPQMEICQTDLPLDWYQEEFKPYAEEFLALPDRKPETVLPWMDRYVLPAVQEFGDQMLLLAHFYMGGEIVKLVEHYGGHIADSYKLALQATEHPKATLFVESAVHFMAETIALLADEHQSVYITNPKSGCTMETMAKEDMVEPLVDELKERYGDDLMVVAYMNTSGRIKAIAGETGGAVCTSSNAPVILRWAMDNAKKVLFLPDQHLGFNTAAAVGISDTDISVLPSGHEAAQFRFGALSSEEQNQLDASPLLLWGGFCGVHTVFQPRHVRYWQEKGARVLVHPECPRNVVSIADGSGSTNYLWGAVLDAQPGERLAIATEGHFVRNAIELGKQRGVQIVNVADVPGDLDGMGCGCATMSRNDPPHLVALLDLLRKGKAPDLNRVLPGDVVDERTGRRERLDWNSQQRLVHGARKSLQKMIQLTEDARKSGN